MSTTQKRLGKRPWLNQGEAKAIYKNDGVWIVTGYDPDLIADLKIIPPHARQYDDQAFAWWFDWVWENGVLQLVQPHYPNIKIVKRTGRAIDVPPLPEDVAGPAIAQPEPSSIPSALASRKVAMPLAQAEAMAEQLRDNLSQYCERIVIAGSIRRQKPTIGDIELVCIPKGQVEQGGLFDAPIAQGLSQLDQALSSLVDQKVLLKGDRQGPKYKKFHNNTIDPSRQIQLDVYITTPEEWPVALAIRTGSSSYSQQLVVPKGQKTREKRHGLLKPNYRIGNPYRNRLWHVRTKKIVHLSSEREFFESYITGGWREPPVRH